MCVYLCWSDLKGCKKTLWLVGMSMLLSRLQPVYRDIHRETGDPARLPAQLAGRWGQINWNSVRPTRAAKETQKSLVLAQKDNKANKKGPLSFVLFESPPLDWVSTVSRGHPSVVSLSLALEIMWPCEEEKKSCFNIFCNCRSKDRTTSPLSLASTNEEDAGSEPAQVIGGNSCSCFVVDFLFIQHRRTIRFNRPYAPYGAFFLFNCVIRSMYEWKTLRFRKRVSRRGTGQVGILLFKGTV
jgi:hypothetical protein